MGTKTQALVFDLSILKPAVECGGEVRIIASIEEPVVIRKILRSFGTMTVLVAATAWLPESSSPTGNGIVQTEGMSPAKPLACKNHTKTGQIRAVGPV